ncbi:MAG: UDP-N-acetylglucosamine 2-epimerase [Bryobacteraceae bacterium]|jgi:UDP-N-acetylglucosamine 2-epimerase
MRAVDGCPFVEGAVFVTGMHMLSRYGLTIDEVIKAGFTRIHAFMNQFRGEPSEHVLANTITGLSRYVQEYEPDMIVVHGDRIETLAGAIVGALRNVLVAHIVIYPNNDPGSDCILARYAALDGDPRFKLLPSMRFESFLTLLKHAQIIVGNSSAGIREAPVFGVPTVNVGSRQQNRFRYESILDVPDDRVAIGDAIARACRIESVRPSRFFGDGHSAPRFLRALSDRMVWETPRQKQFCDFEAVPALDRL